MPIFINGVEAHTVVRDLLTSTHEQALIGEGKLPLGTLKREALAVDAVVSPLRLTCFQVLSQNTRYVWSSSSSGDVCLSLSGTAHANGVPM